MMGMMGGKMGMMGMMGGKMGMGMMGGMGGGGKVPVVEVDPAVDEEAAAVGDPHMTLSTGEMKDLSEEDLAFLQDEQRPGKGGMMGMMGMGKMGMMGMGKMGMMGMGMMGGMGGGDDVPAVEVDPVVDEEAAAVGDPHMTLSTGETKDLSPDDLALSFLQMDQRPGKMGMMGMMGKMGMMGMGKMGMMGMGKM